MSGKLLRPADAESVTVCKALLGVFRGVQGILDVISSPKVLQSTWMDRSCIAELKQ